MTALPKAFACAFALAGATFAQAQDYDRLARHPGTVRHAPLRVEVAAELGLDGVFPRESFAPALAELLALPEYADRALEFRVDGMRLVAVEGTTRADVIVLASAGLGGEQAGTLRADEDVRILGRESADGPRSTQQHYYRIQAGAVRGLVPAAQVQIGESNSIAGKVGDLLAPLFAKGSELRKARFFHPDGEVFRAKVESLHPQRFSKTADAVAGAALIRMGQGFWKVDKETGDEPDRMDALSLAIRFYDPAAGPPSPTPRDGDFDLLVASWSERLNHFFWRTPWKTDVHDFFANEYHPAVPFELEGEEVWVRVIPAKVDPQGPNRIGKLLAAVESGQAVFFLEIQGEGEQVKTRRGTRTKPRVWTRIAKIQLEEHLPDFDQDALHYSPTMGGRGFEPTGWVTRIRRPVYRQSQDARDGLVDRVDQE